MRRIWLLKFQVWLYAQGHWLIGYALQMPQQLPWIAFMDLSKQYGMCFHRDTKAYFESLPQGVMYSFGFLDVPYLSSTLEKSQLRYLRERYTLTEYGGVCRGHLGVSASNLPTVLWRASCPFQPIITRNKTLTSLTL